MRIAHFIIFFLLTQMLLLLSCVSKQTETSTETDESLSVSKKHSLTFVGLEERAVFEVLELNGRIGVPPENDYIVSSLFAGSVQSIYLLPGNQVKKGDLLLEIQDEQILSAQQRFTETAANNAFQRAEFERSSTLFKEEIISRKQFQLSEQAYKAAESAYQSALRTIGLMGLEPERILSGEWSARLKIYAPFSGVISEINAIQGQFVTSNEPLMRLTKTEHLHVEFPIYEADISRIFEEQRVLIARPNTSDYALEASVHKIGKTVEAETRSIPVHADFTNPDDQLLWVPGRYVQLKVLLNESLALTLPESAITVFESSNYALRLVGETDQTYQFEKVFIRKGKTAEGVIEVLNFKDLRLTDRFLSAGVFELITN
jgi:cobalt-zinc-cadmium efflux system membrane fusion protein